MQNLNQCNNDTYVHKPDFCTTPLQMAGVSASSQLRFHQQLAKTPFDADRPLLLQNSTRSPSLPPDDAEFGAVPRRAFVQRSSRDATCAFFSNLTTEREEYTNTSALRRDYELARKCELAAVVERRERREPPVNTGSSGNMDNVVLVIQPEKGDCRAA